MEGSSLVLEKNDSEDSCGDQEERSSDIVFHVIFDILGIYCHYTDMKDGLNLIKGLCYGRRKSNRLPGRIDPIIPIPTF